MKKRFYIGNFYCDLSHNSNRLSDSLILLYPCSCSLQKTKLPVIDKLSGDPMGRGWEWSQIVRTKK